MSKVSGFLNSVHLLWQKLIKGSLEGYISPWLIHIVQHKIFFFSLGVIAIIFLAYFAFLKLPPGKAWSRRRLHTKRARLFERSRRFEEAGNQYLLAGDRGSAMKAFTEGGVNHRIADMLLEEGKAAEAAEYYEKGRRYEQAAVVYESISVNDRAAECYAKAGKWNKAAENFEIVPNPRRAAECYARAGDYVKAQKIYVELGDYYNAARVLEEHYLKEMKDLATTQSLSPDIRKMALQSGKFYILARKPREAAVVLSKGAWYHEAAKAYLEAGDYKNAVNQFVKAADFENAADVCEKAGNKTLAAKLRARFFASKGQFREAAEQLESIQDYEEAAKLYQKAKMWAKTGEMFKNIGDYRQAAEMFAIGEKYEDAAEMYQRVGKLSEAQRMMELVDDPEKAVGFYLKEKKYLDAARHLLKHKRIEKAIGYLQLIDPDHKEYLEACKLLGELFVEKGQFALGIKKFREGFGNRMTKDNLEAFYEFALKLEKKNATDEALKIYEEIMGIDIKFPKIQEKVDSLQHKSIIGKTVIFDKDRSVRLENGDARSPRVKEQRYQIVREIGRGGMGIVYKARDLILRRDVAFKVISENLRNNRRAIEDFYREAQATAALSHPFLLTIYDIGERNGYLYIIMEYVEGRDFEHYLRSYSQKGKFLPINVVARIFRWVCEGLEHAHGKGIIHRDIKPSNIMWTKQKQIKIMDFGLAVLMGELQKSGIIAAGTPHYMSPEQIVGGNIDHRTDIYSLGVTVFRMLTNEFPFKGTIDEIMLKHLNAVPPRVEELNPEVPECLASIVHKCMEKKPEKRFTSAGEIAYELQKIERSL